MRKLCSVIILALFLTIQAVPAESCSTFQVANPNLIKINDSVLLKTSHWSHYVSQSYLAGIGIRSSLQAGLSSNMDPTKIWNSVTTGLLQGVTSIGLNFAAQELNIPPLLTNLGFSLISTALNAGVQATIGDNPQHKSVFELMFDTYENNALTFLGYGNSDDPGYAWQQAAYISQILDFSNLAGASRP